MLNKGSRRWLLAAGVSLAASTLLVTEPSSAQEKAQRRWRPPPAPNFGAIRASLEDADGRSLRSFMHGGQTFVLGRFGERYGIRIHNPLAVRVEAVVTVDGRDVVSGKKGDFVSNRGYVIGPHDSLLIDGFRTSLDEVAAFRFVDPGDSYSARRGTPENVGVIGVALFAERVPQAVARDEAPNAKSSSPAHRAPKRKGASAERRSQNLGTEFGEARLSRVREVTFERQSPRSPTRVIALRYDDAAGLEARGIDVFDDLRRSELDEPEPFPNSRFAPPPPRRFR
ncbi:MAG TPA: hypothetical protein VM686_06235 [Polyangiaceae bacterium]|nr:hypothetical protein [Polyangiaceae bacterium]